MTKAIHVCALSRLHSVAAATGARHVATLINAGTEVLRPAQVAAEHHLFIGVNDIQQAMEGYTLPDEAHVARFFDFVRLWHESAPTPLIVHCWAGVSRSTAAAYSAALMLRPDWNEQRLALFLRAQSPSATPNAKIIAIADDMLGRKGRMVDAIKAIGRGQDAFEGVPFQIDLGDDLR